MSDYAKASVFLLSLITNVFGQGAIGSLDTCLEQQNVTDNLSSPRTDMVLQCIPRTNLCDITRQCPSGADEGLSAILGNLVCE